nr:MAG TPA: hypothetical protein [Caudoviricetes sp.]
MLKLCCYGHQNGHFIYTSSFVAFVQQINQKKFC